MSAGVHIPGVPESITRENYVRLIESAGFNARELMELRFAPDGIYATVFALDDKGRRMLDPGANKVVTHEVYVRVER